MLWPTGVCTGSLYLAHDRLALLARICPYPSLLLQEIAWNLGGTVAKCSHREYGFARVQINKFGSDRSSVDALFEGLGDEMEVRPRFLFSDGCSFVVLQLIGVGF